MKMEGALPGYERACVVEIFWLGASGARACVIPLGAWRNAAVEAQLAEPQGRDWRE
jgi:hypothetical protein